MDYEFNSTDTDRLIQLINDNKPKEIAYVKKLFDAFETSQMLVGQSYYRGDTDILKRTIKTYVNEEKIVDQEATNKKLATGLYKMLVDQKVAYLAGEPMTWGSKSDNREHLNIIEDTIGKRWGSLLPQLIKNSSNKGKEWLMPYVDELGEFDLMTIGAEQVIPIYDSAKRFKLVAAIRFYRVNEEHIKLELWTEADVTYYEIIKNEIYIDVTHEINPAAHFYNSEGTEGKSWGKVPLIKYANNDEEFSDLKIIKPYIDEYELLTSDAQNTLSDMQSLIYVLKGYEGESLSVFQTNMKRYKAVKIEANEGSGVDTLTAEVPVQAYITQIELLRKGIITYGQGVDPSPEVIGNSPSGVALKNLYNSLDQKASQQERIFEDANKELLYFLEVYCSESRLTFDANDITCSFTKSTITNEQEIIDNLIKSTAAGILSVSSAITQHPYVQNAEDELEKIQQQKEVELSAYSERYGELNEGDPDAETN